MTSADGNNMVPMVPVQTGNGIQTYGMTPDGQLIPLQVTWTVAVLFGPTTAYISSKKSCCSKIYSLNEGR